MYTKSFETLEFTKIKQNIAELAISPMAKEMILELQPFDNIYDVNDALTETSDGVKLITKQGSPPLRGIKDIKEILKRLEVGGSLSIYELLYLADVLRATKQVKSYYKSGKDFIDPLPISDYFTGLDPLHHLYTEISRCIISEEEVADDASHDLSKIRREIKSIAGRVKGQLNKIIQSASQAGYLQDNTYTIRNDRYCVPLKTEYRSSLKGIIHDQSSTGATLFVEPNAIVELNNNLSSLYIKEKKEIEKILAALSQDASLHIDALGNNSKLLTRLDFIFAKGNYSMNLKCSCPTFNEDYKIMLEKARHPLLDQDSVVPTTIYLGDEFSTLVVTGPNTGGKTVTLKTLGLLSLMGQSGLHIPAFDGAKLTILDNIFADIGDEQSIEQSLSTFSSHMTNITFILEHVTDKSLVLFDELGAGTDPVEGAALAMAILESLKEANILTAATTHYSELKVYALSTQGVENASCEFNVNTLRPTYKLLIGIPGKSNAFAISKRLGLSDYIIDEAKELLNGREVRFEDLITDLETNKKTALLEKEKAEQFRLEAEGLKKQVEQQRQRLTSQKQRIMEEARLDAMRVLEEAKVEADGIISKMNDLVRSGTGLSMADLEKQRTNLREKIKKNTDNNLKEVRKTKNFKPENLKAGDSVFVTTLNQKGTVISISPTKKEALVQMGIMKSKVPFNAIDVVMENLTTHDSKPSKHPSGKKYQQAKGNKNKGTTSVSRSGSARAEVDVRGTIISDAIEIVDKYLDDAYLSHLPQVTIIHGKGTGALRQGIHQFLRTSPHVNSYRLGEFGEGDSGVTIVEFKE